MSLTLIRQIGIFRARTALSQDLFLLSFLFSKTDKSRDIGRVFSFENQFPISLTGARNRNCGQIEL